MKNFFRHYALLRGFFGGGDSGSGGSGGVQSNWDQNNPEAADYVKNRTHYSRESAVLERQTYGFQKTNGLYISILPATLTIPMGEITVFWDGVEYKYTDAYQTFGNMALIGGEDTGEPFVFANEGGAWLAVANNTARSHEVGIVGEDCVKIDKKFMPDGWTRTVFVTLSNNGGEYTVDKTYDELALEINSGANVVLRNESIYYPMMAFNEDNGEIIFATWEIYGEGGARMSLYVVSVFRDKGVSYSMYQSGEFTRVR